MKNLSSDKSCLLRITAADREFDAALIYSPGRGGETKQLVEQAKKLPDLGAARVLLHDPSGALEPHRAHERAGVREGHGHLAVDDAAHDPVCVVRASEQDELPQGIEPPLR